MVRMTIIVLLLSVCLPEVLRAEVGVKAGETDSSAVEIGAYVAITYGEGERDSISGKWERMTTVRGYIKAVDSERVIIGVDSWKTEIDRDRIHNLIALSAPKMTTGPRSWLTRYKPELTLETGYFFNISKMFTGFYNFGDRYKKSLWAASLYFGDFLSDESRSRVGLRCAYQKVNIFAVSPDREYNVSHWRRREAEIRQREDGMAARLLSLLLVFQKAHVLNNRKQVVLLADFAFGLSFENIYYRSGGGYELPTPTTRPRGSLGAAILVPVHPHINVQAAVRADLFSEYLDHHFFRGMTVAVGPSLKF